MDGKACGRETDELQVLRGGHVQEHWGDRTRHRVHAQARDEGRAGGQVHRAGAHRHRAGATEHAVMRLPDAAHS